MAEVSLLAIEAGSALPPSPQAGQELRHEPRTPTPHPHPNLPPALTLAATRKCPHPTPCPTLPSPSPGFGYGVRHMCPQTPFRRLVCQDPALSSFHPLDDFDNTDLDPCTPEEWVAMGQGQTIAQRVAYPPQGVTD